MSGHYWKGQPVLYGCLYYTEQHISEGIEANGQDDTLVHLNNYEITL